MSSIPRRMRPGNNFNFDSSTTSSNAASIPPTPDGATFRDLLIFEERLKQNAARLQRRKHKYQGILLLLCAAILLLSYHVLLFPKPQHPLVHYAQLVSLVVCGTTVFLFFASGMYAERIVAANRFVPQANRALRPFNMYLNTRRPPAGDSWLPSLPFIKSGGSSAVGTAGAESSSAGSISTAVSKSSHFPGAASPTSLSGGPTTRLVRDAPDPTNPTALPPLRRMQIQPIPPSSNPRGEMIFSSKVSLAFREGYERYRNVFERRRKEKLDAADMESRMTWRWRRWVFALRGGGGATGGGEARHYPGEKGLEAGVGGSGLGTPTSTRRATGPGEKSSAASGGSGTVTTSSGRTRGASSSSGQTGGGGHKKGASRHHPHRTRTNSSASIASSTASNSTQSSAHGHGGGGDAPSSSSNPTCNNNTAAAAGNGEGNSPASSPSESGSATKRKSSPRRKHRDAPPAGSSSLRRSSRAPGVAEEEQGQEEEQKVEEREGAGTEPDPTKVADEGDDRADAEATLREPAPAAPATPAAAGADGADGASTEEDLAQQRQSAGTSTSRSKSRSAKNSSLNSAPSSSSSSSEEEEEEDSGLVDRSLIDLDLDAGSASNLLASSEKEGLSASATRSASGGKEGEGWVEVRRTNSSRRGGGGGGAAMGSAS